LSGGQPDAASRLLCIGDVHGCAAELSVLLGAVDPSSVDRLVFLGDYVDRGPASKECLDLLADVRETYPNTVCLRGNHEDMFLAYLGLDGHHAEVFLANGGAATLRSYGLDVSSRHGPGAERARAQVAPAHLAFLSEQLVMHHSADGYTFVHAGVRPGIPIERQEADDLLWIREAFLSAEHGLPSTVVFGHTPHREVLFDPPRKIGLDTGCVYGGRLSCLDLTTGVLHQVVRGARNAMQRDVRRQLG